jgi:hypothetical protein
MDYFHLESKESKNAQASIFTTVGMPSWENMISMLEGVDRFPLPLCMVHTTMKEGKVTWTQDLKGIHDRWPDYPQNQFAYPFMSGRMAEIVKSYLTGEENVDWIVADVSAESESRLYYLPRFLKKLDVLDLEKTRISALGTYSVGYFKEEKIRQFAMFHSRFSSWQITSSLVINGKLMEALRNRKITGIEFSPARIS